MTISGSSSKTKLKRRKQRVLVMYKKSAYQLLVRERKNPRAQALLERKDRSVERMLASHQDHAHTIQETRNLLERMDVAATFRYRVDPDLTENFDLVISLGGDGTLLRASHLVGKQPVLAINTAPRDSVGYFCGGTKDNLEQVLVRAIEGSLPGTALTRAQLEVDGEVMSRRILNDVLFSHECPAATTRYLIRLDDIEEEHRSSGVWIGPAAGSTAAQRSAGGRVLPPTSKLLQFVVREPYVPNGKRYRLAKGTFGDEKRLSLVSKMLGGRLYVDGPHMRVAVDLGSEIVVRRSTEPLTVLGFRQPEERGTTREMEG